MPLVSRRHLLGHAMAVVGGWALVGCAPGGASKGDPVADPRGEGGEVDPSTAFVDSVDAAFDILIPAERDASGKVLVVGARECGASRLLDENGFALFALAQGFVPRVSDRVLELVGKGGNAFRVAAN